MAKTRPCVAPVPWFLSVLVVAPVRAVGTLVPPQTSRTTRIHRIIVLAFLKGGDIKTTQTKEQNKGMLLEGLAHLILSIYKMHIYQQ